MAKNYSQPKNCKLLILNNKFGGDGENRTCEPSCPVYISAHSDPDLIQIIP